MTSDRFSTLSRVWAGLALTAVTLLGLLGLPRFRERARANSAMLNDLLPVHSKWWREHGDVEGELVYVAVGDSAAQGIGASRPDLSYVGILADHLRATTGRTIRVVNLSVSGATTKLAVRDQLPRFRSLHPDIVTVAIGANDIANWNPDAFGRNIRTIFAALPHDAIVADLPCFHLRHNERKVTVANRILREIARQHDLTVVPLHALTRQQGLVGILTQFAEDMFHPNDHGYRVWAAAFRPALDTLLRRRGLVHDEARAATSVVGGAR
ncbi:SGNH/GDSL hydrolase family protein [Agromyces bauzanensis]